MFFVIVILKLFNMSQAGNGVQHFRQNKSRSGVGVKFSKEWIEEVKKFSFESTLNNSDFKIIRIEIPYWRLLRQNPSIWIKSLFLLSYGQNASNFLDGFWKFG